MLQYPWTMALKILPFSYSLRVMLLRGAGVGLRAIYSLFKPFTYTTALPTLARKSKPASR